MKNSTPKILVIGDSCTDIFIYGNIKRICPEAPVPVFNPTHQTENGGMARNVKNNLEALGCDVDIITNPNDIKKIRYVDSRSNQIVLRVDEHDYCEPVNSYYLDFDENKYDAIIISDYCKGFLSEENMQYLCNYKNVFIDTKRQIGKWINNVDFIKINELEYEKNQEFLNKSLYNSKLIVTLGSKGCKYIDDLFPVKEVSARDVSGAGDTFLAGLVTEYVKSNDIRKSIRFAQECTIKVVQKAGVETI